LPADFHPANTSPQLSGPYPGKNATRGYLVGENQDSLEYERQQQRAQDREREQFKRDEMEFELGGEESDSGPAYYVKINGGDAIRDQQGRPRRFPSFNAAHQMAQRYMMKYPDRKAEAVNIFFDVPMMEAQDRTYEDILSSLQRKLGDYLQDVATAVKKDPDLIDKLPQDTRDVQAVKTIRTDDGHEIKIHGNEDDGFRISIKNRDIKSSFGNLDEAVMAVEMYCARRRSADYLDEKSLAEEKKDACYHKVKSRYKVWPSAYASGALVQCRKKGAKNWGEKSKTPEEVELDESLKNKLAAAGVAATMALSPAHARVTDGGQSFAQQTAQQSSQHQSVKTPKQIPSKSYLQNVASGKSRSLMDPDTAKELLKKYYNEKR